MFFFRSSTSNFFSRLLMTEFCTRNPSFYLSLQLVWGRTSQQDPDGFFSGIFRFRWIFAVVAVVVVAGRVRPVVGRADARTLAPARAVETQRTLACQSLMIPAAQKKNPSPATSESDLMDNLLVLVPPPPTHPQPTPISSPNLSPPPCPSDWYCLAPSTTLDGLSSVPHQRVSIVHQWVEQTPQPQPNPIPDTGRHPVKLSLIFHFGEKNPNFTPNFVLFSVQSDEFGPRFESD